MKRLLTSALALGLAVTSFPSIASARDWHHGYRHHRGDAVAAGVVGLAFGALLGAAITDSNRHRYYDRCYDRCSYDRGYYDEGYYGDDYYDGPSVCVVRERRWDPYTGRPFIVEERRPC